MTLTRLGLTADQERIYRRLLRQRGPDGALTPIERDALGDLRALGLLHEDLSPVPPATAVEALVHRRIDEARRQLAGLSDVWDALRELGEEHRTGKPVDPVEFLATSGDADRRIHKLLHREPGELLSVQATPGHSPLLRFGADHDRLLAAGLRSRVLFSIEAMEDPDHLAHARARHALGELHRATGRRLGPLVIVNRSSVFARTDQDEGVAQIRHSALVRFLAGVFDHMWGLAHDVTGQPLTPTQLRVLHALTCHDTDETAARSINVSVRTFRSHVAAVMDRLGVRTRFQAALLAREKGWL
ncbi:helix-turn-helix transcriptional regulator [Nocardia abscessus]|uniref:helix-turn-helix transcriptional regulator n=1 Tax=Nocardia abscessus TaxID=120957 RepID=UPI0024554D80|nr:LuxR C-terminal-related transcriptional regulator [Nocardia abscessus]